MYLERYLFEHSYLTGLEYNPVSCSLKLLIDAKITYEHPKADKINDKATFIEIEVLFEGVQYSRLLSSPLLNDNPNDDLGSIEQFYLKNSLSVSQGLTVEEKDNKQNLSLDLTDGNIYSVLSKSREIKFLNFISEMVSFELGFGEVIIKEIE
jgi:hypothetical protein